MTPQELQDLKRAKILLEKTAVVAKLSELAGRPIEIALDRLPNKWKLKIQETTKSAIQKAMEVAISTLPKEQSSTPSRDLSHRLMVAATGAGGGAMGLAALPIELPISTTLILRAILDIARSEGEDLSDPQTRISCLEVFAFSGPTAGLDATEAGYFAVRAALAKSVSEAAVYLARKGLADAGAPALAKLVIGIATRFEIIVAQKIAAQLVPLIGAIGGAGLNLLFMEHFQEIARGHFIIKKLERVHGSEEIKRQYAQISLH